MGRLLATDGRACRGLAGDRGPEARGGRTPGGRSASGGWRGPSFLLREEGAGRDPTRPVAWGGRAGEKTRGPPLRPRREGGLLAARPSGRSPAEQGPRGPVPGAPRRRPAMV